MLVQSADVKDSEKFDVAFSKVPLIDTFKRVRKPSYYFALFTTVFKETFLEVYSVKAVKSANNTLKVSKHNSRKLTLCYTANARMFISENMQFLFFILLGSYQIMIYILVRLLKEPAKRRFTYTTPDQK